MNLEDLILVSVDDHVVEPPDMFKNRLPARFVEDAPRVVREADGTDYWQFDGIEERGLVGLGAVAGVPKAEYGTDPISYDEIRRGSFEVGSRIDDMNANGILGSMCFPSFPGFGARLFTTQAATSPDLGLAVVKAYNDWHIEDWAGAMPGRLIPVAVLPMWDSDAMAEEVHRMARSGCRAVTLVEAPQMIGLPSFHTDFWDPLWSACADEGTVVCIHMGSSGHMPGISSDAPIDLVFSLHPMVASATTAAELLWSPALRRFPELKIALSEGSAGWVPYFLERVDRVYEKHAAWTGQDFGDRRPSEVFRDHFVLCLLDDSVGFEMRHHIGIDSMTFECDYPHSDSSWPRTPELLYPGLAGLTDDEISKVTYENAIRLFGFNPFSYERPEDCTVGALRARAAHVDVAERSRGDLRNERRQVKAEVLPLINQSAPATATSQS